MAKQTTRLKLVLEDGTLFSGYAFGSERSVSGEVVFTTGMVGYPESLTDPSYLGQILVMTYPLVGNYGVPGNEREDNLLKHFESERIQVSGLILSTYADEYSHWNATRSLGNWMVEHEVPGIYGIDTRALTKRLREHGTMLGKILPENANEEEMEFIDPNARHLVSEISAREIIDYPGHSIESEQNDPTPTKRVTLVDCGVKNAIIRSFLKRGISVRRVPHDHDFLQDPGDGIVISSGPGDPKLCTETIANVKRALETDIPILGICLGSQIIALAAGADTYKLRYGHRSQNQPCVEVGTKDKCYITTQNHGFAVDADSLPQDWREWFYNNNDRSNEGLMHLSKPVFGAQFHPEASPGPDDTDHIFDMFVRSLL
jgi:carbamoyl-phosphate synthase small subunit